MSRFVSRVIDSVTTTNHETGGDENRHDLGIIERYGDVYRSQDGSSEPSSEGFDPYLDALSRIDRQSRDANQMSGALGVLQSMANEKIVIAWGSKKPKSKKSKSKVGSEHYGTEFDGSEAEEDPETVVNSWRCCAIICSLLMFSLLVGAVLSLMLSSNGSDGLVREITEAPTTTTEITPFPSNSPTTSPTAAPTTSAPTTSPIELQFRCLDATAELSRFCLDEHTLVDCVGQSPQPRSEFTDCLSKPDERFFCRCPNGNLFSAQYGCVKINNVNTNCDG